MSDELLELGRLLEAAGITQDVHKEDCSESIRYGKSMWSEVRTDRPPQGQVAHCADSEDADLIVALINYARREVARASHLRMEVE